MHVRRCRAFIATFLTLIPSLMPYLGTLFCVMCIYCSLGVQVAQSSLPLLIFCSKSFTICVYNFWYILNTKSNFVRIKVGRCSGLAPRLFQDSSWIRPPKDTRVEWGICLCVFWHLIQKKSNFVRIKNQTKSTSRYSFVTHPKFDDIPCHLGTTCCIMCLKKKYSCGSVGTLFHCFSFVPKISQKPNLSIYICHLVDILYTNSISLFLNV